MKRAEAERKVISVYRYEYLKLDNNVNATESPMGAIPFYLWLRENRSELLEFRYSGDQYQIIAGWVESLRT